MTREDLLATIQSYCDAAEMRPSVLTRLAVNNGKLHDRLQSGGDCTTSTVQRILEFIKENPPKQRQGAA